MTTMQKVIKVEEVFMFVIAIWAYSQLHFSWWLFMVLILLPDIGMIGYLFNSKVGAITYNICHHKGLAIVIFLIGFYIHIPVIQLIGIILYGHASMDRIFGYGLKYFDNFKHTHLGIIGKQ